MPEVALQEYLQEIDRFIEESQLGEAIRHCRHILGQFPRHVPTYRLLGKALLEDRQLTGARDVFQRVLSADPEDFVAHAGLAIIHKENNHLGDAAWHMQRAFEVEPYNGAIRETLQDLIGRRDGLPPEELTLSRGALARLYVRGELYGQAIAELRELLADDPDRVDLQVLLAEALWRDGQRIEAADECGRILERLPYCIKASAMLAEVWLVTERIEDAQPYLRRVFELVLPTSSSLDDDSAVGIVFRTDGSPALPEEISVERLPPDGGLGGLEDAADWVQDIDLGEELVLDATEPDWLGALQDDTFAPVGTLDALDEPTASDVTGQTTDEAVDQEIEEATSWFSRSSDQLPGIGDLRQETDWEDWLGDNPPRAASAQAELQNAPVDSEIEEAGMAGNDQQNHEQDEFPEMNESPQPESGESGEESKDLDWLDELQEASHHSETDESDEDTASGLPDWLNSGMESEDLGAVDLDWLEEFGGSPESDSGDPSPATDDLPDWLRDELGGEDQATGDDVGEDLSWLDQIAAGEGPPLEEPPTMSWPESDTPDEEQDQPLLDEDSDEQPELIGVSPYDEPDETESAMARDDDQLADDVPEDLDEAMAWLEQLAAQQGAPAEELPSLATTSESEGDEAPEDVTEAMDWLDELARAQDEAESEPLAIGEEPSLEAETSEFDDVAAAGEATGVDEMEIEAGIGRPEVHDGSPELPEDKTEMDEAMAWLEELASEGSAVDDVPALDEFEEETYGESLADLQEVPEDPEQALAWLEGLATESSEVEGEPELAGAVVEEESTPPVPLDVVAARAEAEAILRHDETSEQAPQEAEMLEDIPDDPDEAMAWLERLAARQGASLDELPSLSGVQEEVSTEEWMEDADASLDEETVEMAADSETGVGTEGIDLHDAPAPDDTLLEFESFEKSEFAQEVSEPAESDVEGQGEALDFDEDEVGEPASDEMVGALESDETLPDWLLGESDEDFDEFDWDDEEFDATGWLESEEASAAERVEPETPERAEVDDVIESTHEEPAQFEPFEQEEAAAEVESTREELTELETFAWEETPAEPEPEEEMVEPEWGEQAPVADVVGVEPSVSQEVAEEPGDESAAVEEVEGLPATTVESSPQNVEDVIESYKDRFNQGEDAATLIEELEQAVQDHGDQPQLLQLLGDAYNQNGQLQRALDAYRRALETL